jgi:hypothetical protein
VIQQSLRVCGNHEFNFVENQIHEYN